MRILRLTMDAVGPFPGHEVIDFEAFSDAGRFLLSGPTGAGKSTIIDAIVFALYGKVSGGRDSSDSRIRSRYASEQAKTEVELIFSTSAGNYKVRRQPAYERVKKNGKGVTKQNAKAWLFKLDEQLREVSEPLTKTSDVGTEITRIVGLNREQFTQTVVLPQGKFAQFLRSTSKDRQDLLQELFGTAIFEDLQLDLVERARKVKKNQEALDATLRANLGVLASLLDEAPPLNQERSLVYEPVPEVDCEFDPLETAWISRFEPLAPWLEQNQRCADLEVSAFREQEDKLRSEFTSQRDLAARQERYWALAKEHEQLVAQGPAQRQRLAQIQALQALADLKPWHEQLKQAQQTVAQRQLEQAAALEQLEPDERVQAVLQRPGDYQSAQALSVQLTAQVAALSPQVELEAGLAGRRRDLQAKTQAHESAGTKLAQGRERENQLPTQIASKQELLEQLNEQAATLPAAQLAQEQATQALKLAKDHEQLVEDQQQALKLQQLVALELKQASQKHKHMLEQWLSQSALNLAQNLVDGAPCPVCGATEHPAPATQGGENISQDQLDQALEEVNEVQEELSQASEKVTKLAAQLEAQPCQLSPAQAREQLEEAKAALAAAKQASEQARSCKAHIAKLNAELETLRADNQAAQARLAGDAKEIQLLGEKIESDAASLSCEGFESVAAKVEYLSQLAAGLEQLAKAGQELSQCQKRAQQAADSFAAQWAQASTNFADHSAKPAALAPTDPAETEPAQDTRPTQDTSIANAQDGYAQACQAFAGLDLAALKAASASYEKFLSINQAALAELAGIELTPPPLEQTQAQLEQAQAKTQACQTYASTWQAFAGQVNAQLAKLNKLLARRSQASATDAQLLALASAANGDNHARLTLSAWVLQAHFRQVLVFANERLGVIGAGRYELINVDSEEDTRQQKQGLGLAVVDHLSGTTRSPRTLSGGESFYVSLALALALADVVATQNGGIEMNTLFIDEGFGSLDEGTLAEVMDVLSALHSGGRVVGIVSHVSELKRAIPAAVEVRPLLGGGSTLRTRV